MRMYLDDIRIPEFEYDVIARTSSEAINFIEINGCPEFISFDHDLGGDDTAMIVVKYLIQKDLDNHLFIPLNFRFNVHSANPIGKANIEGYLNCYLRQRNCIN